MDDAASNVPLLFLMQSPSSFCFLQLFVVVLYFTSLPQHSPFLLMPIQTIEHQPPDWSGRGAHISSPALGDLKIALRGVTRTPAEGVGGVEKWGSVSGPLFCVRTDVGAEGAGTQILARKSFFHQ